MTALAGGIAAGLLFFIGLTGTKTGLLFFYLPLLPLFLVGFKSGFRTMVEATMVALLAVALTTGAGGLFLFILLEAVPGLLLGKLLLLWREEDGSIEWYPTGAAISRVIGYAVCLFLLVATYYTSRPGGLLGMVQVQLQAGLGTMDPVYAASVEQIILRMPALLFAASAWVFVMIVYALAWFAHFILREQTPRPSIGILRFQAPRWVLFALVASAAASLLPDAPNAFIGRTVFLALLLPYALSGFAWLHEISRPWVGRGWLLAMFYVTLLAVPWLGIVAAAAGVWEQSRALSRREP